MPAFTRTFPPFSFPYVIITIFTLTLFTLHYSYSIFRKYFMKSQN